VDRRTLMVASSVPGSWRTFIITMVMAKAVCWA
jgi:hypothetical protein